MNVEKMQQLADLLRTIPDEKFDMNTGIKCGTIACAAGWWFLTHAPKKLIAQAKSSASDNEWSFWSEVYPWCRDDLELRDEYADYLFLGKFAGGDDIFIPYIPRERVIEEIERMIQEWKSSSSSSPSS